MLSITTFVIVTVIKIVIALVVLLTAVAYSTWLERKVVGHIQNRWGPQRVGPFGLLQPLADGAKFIFKEDLTPPYVYKPLYLAAPILSLVLALTSISLVPIGNWVTVGGVHTPLEITDVNIGLLIILGITSLSVYGVALAGWSSNSKYSLLGSLRASAQMVSYEIALGLSLVGVLIMSGSLNLREIVDAQGGHMAFWIPRWNIFRWPTQIVAFFVYLTAAFAETNRVPFDLPEAETELVAGYHTEYSSMKFAMFFMAEYANMITVASIATLLFLGGWHGPVFGPGWLQAILPVFWFVLKVFCFIFLYIWIRGTLPRFRYDQLMGFGWKVLFPIAVANVLATSLIVALQK
ncbi:MAG TPA: NADH-quinone oxidoreductase subunit NuoH [Terriglobales bacterium]|jgi:NADH-quinone oxidoreductase subunit H|nr:NADH-quinone oxidoreductase subunit NuoH [Terriglobales bacterium]